MLPDKSVQECHMTLGLYIADLVEQWDLLNLKHFSSVKDIVPVDKFTHFEEDFTARQEHDVCTGV